MTSISSVPDDAAITHQILLHSYFDYLSITFLYYDHMITLDNEIALIWKRRKNMSAYLFFANRYLAFVSNIVVTMFTLSPLSLTDKGCKRYTTFRQLLLVVSLVLVGVLLTLRVYALHRCDKRVLIGMVGTGVALCIGAISTAFIGQHGITAQNSPACIVGLTHSTGIHVAVAWEALFAYDTLVITMTLLKSYRSRRIGINVPLISMLVRDGVTYFVFMALANLANVLTFYIAGPFMKGGLSTFASCLSVTMMSRLMLNLHKGAESGINDTAHTTTTAPNISFEMTSNLARETGRTEGTYHYTSLQGDGRGSEPLGDFEMVDIVPSGEGRLTPQA